MMPGIRTVVDYSPEFTAPPLSSSSSYNHPFQQQERKGGTGSSASSLASSHSGSGVWLSCSNSPPPSPPAPHLNWVVMALPGEEEMTATPQRYIQNNNNSFGSLLNHATPRTYNGNKRRLPPVPPLVTLGNRDNDNTTSSSSSPSYSFDCQSLQHSLKRVRLSSSPGELRLQSDLRQLVLNGPWEQVHEDEWACPLRQCRLERSSVDPMCLIFFWRNAACTLRFPRMYPHQPPTLTQIMNLGSGDTATTNSMTTNNNNHNSVVFGSTRSVPIPLCRAPPTNTATATENQSTWNATSGRDSIFNGWLPTMQLTDVLDYLAEAIVNGGVVGQSGDESGSMVAQQDSTSSTGDEDDDDDDSTTCANNLSTPDDDDDDITMMTTATTTAAHTRSTNNKEYDDQEIVSSFLSPNRFNLGYHHHPQEHHHYGYDTDQNFGMSMDTFNF